AGGSSSSGGPAGPSLLCIYSRQCGTVVELIRLRGGVCHWFEHRESRFNPFLDLGASTRFNFSL
ncbi:MAG: hypothetical protein MKZ70_06265, partial [Opitutales bacterium]|nr:hypothetical protein [Opitutales bacterium]